MDLIVTVPKDQAQHFLNDKVPTIDAWWFVSKRPLAAGPGDLIGFIYHGAIRHVATITRIVKQDKKIAIHFQDCGRIKPYSHKSFQSFRYIDLKVLAEL